MTKEEFQEIAWRDFMVFATGDRSIREEFEQATKQKLDEHNMEDFVAWVTINHWGLDEAPQKFREKYGAAA